MDTDLSFLLCRSLPSTMVDALFIFPFCCLCGCIGGLGPWGGKCGGLPFGGGRRARVGILSYLLVIIVVLFSTEICFLRIATTSGFGGDLPCNTTDSRATMVGTPENRVLSHCNERVTVGHSKCGVIFGGTCVGSSLGLVVLALVGLTSRCRSR